jgi:hypothetical protein
MLRKLKDKSPPNLKNVTEQFDTIFENVNIMSRNFIMELNKENPMDFNTLFQINHSKIKEYEELLPKLMKAIREFGIF